MMGSYFTVINGIIGIYFMLTSTPIGVSSYSWYSTIAEMTNLTLQDRDMLKDFELILKTGKETISQQLQLMQNLKRNSVKFLKRFDRTTSRHDFLKYSLDFIKLLRKLQHDQSFPITNTVSATYGRTIMEFPTSVDKEVALRNLLDLQESHNLSSKDIASGYIMDSFAGEKLPPNEVYDLTNVACDKYSIERCIEWSEEALLMANHVDAKYSSEEIHHIVELSRSDVEYSKLCALSVDSNYIQNASDPNLQCFLWNNFGHPWLLLQPFRSELMSVNPPVVVFYDVITELEIEYIKNISFSRLGQATTDGHEIQIKTDSYRITHNCWIKNNDKTVLKLDRRVEAITGLPSTKTPELLQVANYGIGGRYLTHMDGFIEDAEQNTNSFNRRATFMFYLSDVESGGATVFTYPKIAVKPKKRAAVFWLNLLPNCEERDKKTIHGGCPVLLGSKWVANRWIWETRKDVCREFTFI